MQAKFWLTAWIFAAVKFFLPALLLYFFVIKPLLGSGFGLTWCGVYLFVLCPTLVLWVRRKAAVETR